MAGTDIHIVIVVIINITSTTVTSIVNVRRIDTVVLLKAVNISLHLYKNTRSMKL